MPQLQGGTRLGPYEILALLGAGGMGEVYKARDTRLDRVVAIKILPEQLAGDQHFRQRFEHEARLVAGLNHPHICTLHDVGRQDTTDFLVMEYLDGETLAERLKRGPLPLEEALTVSTQILDGLDRAHRAGIVHRDLKPGNVMLTKSGAKLLDFGLAKGAAATAPGAGLTMMPTTPAALTAQGTILGTFQYMAPEQLNGEEADARTDIFAFGAMLYEMLTGKKAFEGKSHASLIAAILEREPAPVSEVLPLAPATLDRVVRKCLAKDPDARWQTARDLLDEIRWMRESSSEKSQSGVAARLLAGPTAASSKVRVHPAIPWSIAIAALVALGATVFMLRPAPPADGVSFPVFPPDNGRFEQLPFNGPGFAISPEGRHLAYIASSPEGASRIWIRSLASQTPRALAGTEYAASLFWSTDSTAVGFFANGKLKTVAIEGGVPQVLADAVLPLGGTWNRTGDIVFAADLGSPLQRVSASGGPTTPVTSLDPGNAHVFPTFLPDGRHFLFTSSDGPTSGVIYVGSLDSKDIKRVANAFRASYAAPGYLAFLRGTTLVAQSFDSERLSASGEPRPVLDIGEQSSSFDFSQSGTLAYRSGIAALREVTWVDRTGRMARVVAPRGAYDNVALSPDETRISFDRPSAASNDVWLMDLERQSVSRFTFQPPNNNVSVWSPDGRTIAFASSQSRAASGSVANLDIYQRPSNMSGPDQELLKLSAAPIMFPSDWSADGRFLAYYRTDPKTQLDQWVLPLTGDKKPYALLHSQFNESQAQFSPDVRWIAYTSDETGAPEVYVQSFPASSGKWAISTGGGTQPRWNRNGTELFYLGLDRKLMAVAVKTGATFEAGKARALFDTRLDVAARRQSYSVSRDGQRFLLNSPADTDSSPISVVLNWQSLLKK